MTNEIRLYGEEGITQLSEIRGQTTEAEYNILYGVIINGTISYGNRIIVLNVYRDCSTVIHVLR